MLPKSEMARVAVGCAALVANYRWFDQAGLQRKGGLANRRAPTKQPFWCATEAFGVRGSAYGDRVGRFEMRAACLSSTAEGSINGMEPSTTDGKKGRDHNKNLS